MNTTLFTRGNWLPKAGWAVQVVMRRAAAAQRRLLICQNLGGQLPTLLIRQLRPWLQLRKIIDL